MIVDGTPLSPYVRKVMAAIANKGSAAEPTPAGTGRGVAPLIAAEAKTVGVMSA